MPCPQSLRGPPTSASIEFNVTRTSLQLRHGMLARNPPQLQAALEDIAEKHRLIDDTMREKDRQTQQLQTDVALVEDNAEATLTALLVMAAVLVAGVGGFAAYLRRVIEGRVAQVGQAVSAMDQATQRNAALVEQSAAAAESLEHRAQHLVQSVAVFRLA